MPHSITPPQTPMVSGLAFLGLGAMGFGMATNLIKSHQKSYLVTGFDIWKPTLERFTAQGGRAATTPRDTVAGAKYVVLMVATAKQVDDALFGGEQPAWEVLEKDAVVILTSTGPPGFTLDVEKKLAAFGRSDVLLIDAPVSGGTARAANGTLTILASGSQQALDAGRGVLDALSGGLASEGKGNLWIIAGGLGKGTEVKMVHQVLAAVGITLASEVLGLIAKLGLNTKDAFDAINKSEAWNWMVENRGAHTFETEDKVYSALNIMVKDVGIVNSGGRLSNIPLFLSSTTEQVLFSGVQAGYGLIDDSKLHKVYLPQEQSLIFDSANITSKNPSKDAETLLLVQNLMKAVNLAVAAEAMSLGKKVGLDQTQLYDIIKGAAGGSWVFQNRVPELISGQWKSEKSVSEVVKDLKQVIEIAHDLKYPLHLGATTLQLFQMAEFRGWGSESELAVSKIWEA